MVTQESQHTLDDGNALPAIGLGTVGLHGEDGIAAMISALQAGYRLLNTAVNYENEAEVGETVRRSGLRREDVIVATKIPGRQHEHDHAFGSVEYSLRRVGFDYRDLAHIHWPDPGVGRSPQAWRALVTLNERGLVRAIGVSNFTKEHLTTIIDDTGVTPAINQIEMHP